MNDVEAIVSPETFGEQVPAVAEPPATEEVAPEPAPEKTAEIATEEPAEPELPSPDGETRLRELAKLEALNREYAEFAELFPDLSISALPDEVSASVASGTPLAAACALYRLRREREAAKAAEANRKNAELTPGEVRNAPSGYLTLEEMKFMSPSEIRRNYPLVIESLKHSEK